MNSFGGTKGLRPWRSSIKFVIRHKSVSVELGNSVAGIAADE